VRRLWPGLCLLVVLAGCGGGTTTATRTESSTQPGTAAATTGSQGTTTSATTTIPAPTGDHGPVFFETPSHNIGCYVDRESARCDIRRRTWSAPPEPKYCLKAGVDFGQGLVVGPHRAELVCAGDTALGGKAVLGYGESSEHGSYICLSNAAGITCANGETRHGFFLSREGYRIF
jgi:hypothetical protein